MNNPRAKIKVERFLVLVFFLISIQLSAQNPAYFKFSVTTEGIYHISHNQAKELGYDNLDEIGIYGYPGMLPQKLDSTDLSLHSIPTQKAEESLFFYLEGPHRFLINEGKLNYQHHFYSDTLYYLIGKKTSSTEIPILETQNPNTPSGILADLQVLKWESANLLSSGRNWYSDPIFDGQTFSFSFPKPEGSENNLWLDFKLMGQSLNENIFTINANGQSLKTVTIPPITNSTYGIKGREELFFAEFAESSNAKINITLNYRTGDVNGVGYIDYAIMGADFSALNLQNGIYYNVNNSIADIQSSENQKIWKVTNPFQIRDLKGNHSLNQGDKIVVFDPDETKPVGDFQPVDMSLRNLRISSPLLIITSQQLISQANRLASHKNERGIATKVILLEDIYDAFGYGTRDVVAIRNFIAFHFQTGKQLKNILLFGKGTYDYKGKVGGRPNLVPTYSSRSSLNPLTTYSSDDFFGFVNHGQGEWKESPSGDEVLQLGIGRIPAVNVREAAEMVGKIIAYENGTNIKGDWKRKIAFFADDADNNIHLNDAESHARFLNKNNPEFEIIKLYLDRFEQIRSASGQISPQARETLRETVEEGVLILNYIGHGNETTLTAEQVFNIRDLENWPENPFLPLMVTATCEFGRHDSPLIRSGAEEMLFAQNKGAIGMLTTGRPVFSSINFALNKAFIEAVFEQVNGEYPDLGTIFLRTKNNSLNGSFNRNFSLLGDPSLKLALPDLKTEIDEILDISLELSTDTLNAKQIVRINGRIVDPVSQAFVPGAKGIYELMISDKPIKIRTKGDESEATVFLEEGGFLFKGTGEVNDGVFSSEIFIPKNIDYEFGSGKIRVFAQIGTDNQEAMGAQNIVVGGTSDLQSIDQEGPKISLQFGDGTELNPTFNSTKIPLLVNLEDESGINVSPKNIGQDISISINGDSPVILNESFKANNGTYKIGQIQTLMEGFKEGENDVVFEAWDNVGNSSRVSQEIIVQGSLEVRILEHMTYPNPASEKSKFRISHNRPKENILVVLRVYSTMGNEIFRTQKRYVKAESVLEDLEWNFLHNKTKNPAKGVYIYDLELISEVDGTSDRKGGKIVIQ